MMDAWQRAGRLITGTAPILFLAGLIYPAHANAQGKRYYQYCAQLQIRLGGAGGQYITGTTQSVYAGQQIVLYADYALPSGAQLNSQSWSVNGTTVTAWNQASTNGGYTGRTDNAQFSGQTATFYWVVPANSQTATFSLGWGVNGHNATLNAQATFDIYGPTSVGLSPDPPAMNGWTTTCEPSFLLLGCDPLGLGTGDGIIFNASASSPSGQAGTYEWAQIISTDDLTLTYGSTQKTYNEGTGLDNEFPYHGDKTLWAADSPGIGLSSACSEETFSFDAKMYLMWDPETSSSIPIPLGYVSWSAYGDASNNSGSWTVQSDSGEGADSFTLGSSFPGWTATTTNGTAQGCP